MEDMEDGEASLQELMDKMIADLGAAMSGVLVVVGDKLGLYKAIATAGTIDSTELATHTGTAERYVREWLAAQAAAGFITYDPSIGRYSLSSAQAAVFADENSPAFIVGGFEVLGAMFRDEPRITEIFRTGKGMGWHEHDAALFRGTERFHYPMYAAHLVSEWIPALDGVMAKLEQGAEVADVGCGHGRATIMMAQAFPKSRFIGFDYHHPSIKHAREYARHAGVTDRVKFETAMAKTFSGSYDLVTFIDCLHDLGDPVGAAAHVHESLKPDGVWMIVEPFSNEHLEDNINPIGRILYAESAMICTPASSAQEVGLGMGAQAGEKRLREVVTAGGFTHFRRVAQTPFNMVFEVRR